MMRSQGAGRECDLWQQDLLAAESALRGILAL